MGLLQLSPSLPPDAPSTSEAPLAPCCGAGADPAFEQMLSELDERTLSVVLTRPYTQSLTCEQWVALWEIAARNGIPVRVEGVPQTRGRFCAA